MTKWQTEFDLPDFGEARLLKGSDSEIPHDRIEVEDGGRALIYHVERYPTTESGLFVHLKSWADNLPKRLRDDDVNELRAAHPEFAQYAGKRVRVTVEVIDDA